ncbi:MAG: AmmeMemoRadiSam system protein B [Thermodesulfobacteriota bacterium]
MGSRKRNLPRGWYPYDGKDCQKEIESYLESWSFSPSQPFEGWGGIVPHAGWYFSGKLSARVFHSLKSKRQVELVILYGGHLSSENLPLVVTEDKWETPLGEVEIHTEFVNALMKRIETRKESPQSGDNTLEIQLALVKYFFPESKLLAIRSPASLRAKELGEAVAEIAQKEGISFVAVGSTDLTHYGPNYGFLKKGAGPRAVEWVKKENDRGFIDRALQMDIEGLLKHAEENSSACSAGAAASAMASCKAMGAKKGILLDYYTSYEVMPDESFVGYGGILY